MHPLPPGFPSLFCVPDLDLDGFHLDRLSYDLPPRPLRGRHGLRDAVLDALNGSRGHYRRRDDGRPDVQVPGVGDVFALGGGLLERFQAHPRFILQIL